jgi:UDPglucose--hexose-1-phosphate uridylyltransferase
VRTTPITLADGRELVYYDRDGAPERVGVDARTLERRPPPSELRYDALRDCWVIVAAFRQERTYFPPADACPLCPSSEANPSEIPAADYEVAVFENRFPALSGSAPSVLPEGADPFASRLGSGRCEVVAFSPVHDHSFVDLSPEQVALVLDVWTDRSRVLAALPVVEQVYCFENRGVEIGVTLQHPHGQIYAYPFVTPRTAEMLASVTRYHERTGRNLFDDVVSAVDPDKTPDADRLIIANRSWVAFVPYAARWPYEAHLYPRRRVPDLVGLDDEQRADFPSIYLDLLRRFDGLFAGRTPYIAGWHQSPVNEGRAQWDCHLELFTVRRTADKLKFLAASESGMDAFANDVAPEDAAARLRGLGG